MSKDRVQKIDLDNIPDHIAIIMDGNGRWAKSRLLPRTLGHKAGVESIREVVKACSKLGVKHLTLYAFSTENWKRPKREVNALMSLLSNYLRNEARELDESNVRVSSIGFVNYLPEKCQIELNSLKDLTYSNTGLNLNLALNYGSRADMSKAVKNIVAECMSGNLNVDNIDESIIKNHLGTKSIPDPDLIIRTSGEQRLSNFLLWEAAYSEFYFTEIHWPDFDRVELEKAIYSYQKRDRRFGGLK